jgi:hypothetical protein
VLFGSPRILFQRILKCGKWFLLISLENSIVPQNEIAGEVKGRRELAKEMRKEAEEVIKQAKEKVEKMILGEEID